MRFWIFLLFVPITLRAQTPQPRERWEYSTLSTVAGWPFIWTSADSERVDTGAVKLLKGGLKDSDRSGTTKALVAFLNHLGAEDWEIVSTQPQGLQSTLYVFKRRRQ
jgi:hypothetical protein